MKELSASLRLAAAAPGGAHAPCLLAEVEGWGGATVRWAQSDRDVSWGGQTYAARPFQVGGVEVSLSGSSQRLTLGVSNEDLLLSRLCAAADPRGARVTVRRVFLDAPAAGSQVLAAALVVRGWRLTGQVCELTAEGLSALLRRRVPARLFARNCGWEFRGSECRYAGAETACDYTRERCRQLENLNNYGGFRFVLPVVPR